MLGSPIGDVIAAPSPSVRKVSTSRAVNQLVVPVRTLVFALELETYAGFLQTNRYTTVGFTTGPRDTPPDSPIEGRLIRPIEISRRMRSDRHGAWTGMVVPAFGEVELENEDGELDFLADRAVDGRRVTLRMGSGTRGATGRVVPPAYRQMTPIMSAAGDSWAYSETRLRLRLQDQSVSLRVPVQTARYAGTGGIEGIPELKGRTKPRTLGRCNFVFATLLDPFKLIYQIDSGRVQGIDRVYDKGVELTKRSNVTGGYAELEATLPGPGEWVAAPNVGCFRLGSVPAGTVTADVRGAILDRKIMSAETFTDGSTFSDGSKFGSTALAFGYSERVADLILTVLTLGAGWPISMIDEGSFNNLRAELPAPVGMHIATGAERNLDSVIDDLCQGSGLTCGPDNMGFMKLFRLTSPNATGVYTYDEGMGEITALERVPVPFRVPYKSWQVAYARVWQVLSPDALAGAVSETRKAELGKPYKVARAENLGHGLTHPTATASEVVEAHFAAEDDARAEAQRRLALYSPGRACFRFRTKTMANIQLCDTVVLRHSRYGLANGRPMRVIETSVDYLEREMELVVYG